MKLRARLMLAPSVCAALSAGSFATSTLMLPAGKALDGNQIAFGAVVLIGCAGSLIYSWALQRSISRDIAQSAHAANEAAEGRLDHQPTSDRQDEVGDLLRGLGRMVSGLRTSLQTVRAATDSIGTASAEIATGNADLSRRTEQTASNLQQTASSMAQLTGTVKQSADAAHTANQLASSAAAVAAKGGAVVSQVVATMDEINSSSKKISDIIGVIDGIAFQTNILALNAAVEAARAGEQGRGFAVVAGEVRSLAQRSAEAAKEIKSLIGTSVSKVESGTRLVQDAGSTMTEIVASVQRVTDIIGEITAASAEQSEGIGTVNSAVVQLDQMTAQNAALVEQSSAAADSLKQQSARLAQVVATFRLGGTAMATPVALASVPLRTVKHVEPVLKATPATSKAVTKAVTKAVIERAKQPSSQMPTHALATTPASHRPATIEAAAPAQKTLPAPAPSVATASAAADDDWETF